MTETTKRVPKLTLALAGAGLVASLLLAGASAAPAEAGKPTRVQAVEQPEDGGWGVASYGDGALD